MQISKHKWAPKKRRKYNLYRKYNLTILSSGMNGGGQGGGGVGSDEVILTVANLQLQTIVLATSLVRV